MLRRSLPKHLVPADLLCLSLPVAALGTGTDPPGRTLRKRDQHGRSPGHGQSQVAIA